jgi:DNA-binding beta-propeller fold protein YncE
MDMMPLVDQRGSALYVALGKRGAVAIVDVERWRVTATVPLSDQHQPHHLGLSPDRRLLGVAAPADEEKGGSAGLYLLDTRTGQVLARAMPGGTVQNLAFLPGGKLVVYAVLERDRLFFADAATLMPDGLPAAVDQQPMEATVLPDGQILVANARSNTVALVDRERRVTLKTLKVCEGPNGAWYGKAGDRPKAYVTCEGDKRLNVIDLTTMAVEDKFTGLPGTPGQAVTTVDGQHLYIAISDPRQVQVMKAADLSVVAQIEVGQRPHGLAVDPDGKTIYLADEAGQIHALDVATRKAQKSLPIAGTPRGIVFRPPL